MKKQTRKFNWWLGTNIFLIIFYIFGLVTWVINLFQFLGCDFNAPYRDEAIHLIGVCVPFSSIVTIWL